MNYLSTRTRWRSTLTSPWIDLREPDRSYSWQTRLTTHYEVETIFHEFDTIHHPAGKFSPPERGKCGLDFVEPLSDYGKLVLERES